MKKTVLITGLLCFTLTIFGQDAKKNEKTYGGTPTANENMNWEENRTVNEFYTGVIQVDSTINASKIIDAFISTFQPMQDANIMTKQMRSNSAWGGALSAVNGDYDSMSDFSSAGDSAISAEFGTAIFSWFASTSRTSVIFLVTKTSSESSSRSLRAFLVNSLNDSSKLASSLADVCTFV